MYIFSIIKNIFKKQKVKFLLFLLNKNSLIFHFKRISSLAHREVPQIRYGSPQAKLPQRLLFQAKYIQIDGLQHMLIHSFFSCCRSSLCTWCWASWPCWWCPSSPAPSPGTQPMLDGMFYFCQETVGTETDHLSRTYCTYWRWTVRFDAL
jgi:hypothetical protein